MTAANPVAGGTRLSATAGWHSSLPAVSTGAASAAPAHHNPIHDRAGVAAWPEGPDATPARSCVVTASAPMQYNLYGSTHGAAPWSGLSQQQELPPHQNVQPPSQRESSSLQQAMQFSGAAPFPAASCVSEEGRSWSSAPSAPQQHRTAAACQLSEAARQQKNELVDMADRMIQMWKDRFYAADAAVRDLHLEVGG